MQSEIYNNKVICHVAYKIMLLFIHFWYICITEVCREDHKD